LFTSCFCSVTLRLPTRHYYLCKKRTTLIIITSIPTFFVYWGNNLLVIITFHPSYNILFSVSVPSLVFFQVSLPTLIHLPPGSLHALSLFASWCISCLCWWLLAMVQV
jgi:hypothetical protein